MIPLRTSQEKNYGSKVGPISLEENKNAGYDTGLGGLDLSQRETNAAIVNEEFGNCTKVRLMKNGDWAIPFSIKIEFMKF